MIRLIEINQKFPGDIIEDVKSGKVHVVCMAQNGSTHLNVYTELYYKLPKELVNQCVNSVNSKKETGTLFPQANITILPKSENKSDWNQNPQTVDPNELENCIVDVFKANQEYLKSEIIYFTLENSYVNKRLALSIIRDKIEQFNSNELFVKTIWFEE
jgi:hypothetical protein